MDIRNLGYLIVNQGYRPAAWLAEVNGKHLYEYEMPGWTSALVELKVCDKCGGSGQLAVGRLDRAGRQTRRCTKYGCWGKGYIQLRTISYARLPRYWIEALVAHGNEDNLYFRPQQVTAEQYRASEDRYNKIVEGIRNDR